MIYHSNKKESKDFEILYYFHKSWLEKLKRATQCQHIIHVRKTSNKQTDYFLRLHFKNINGGKDIVTYRIGVHPNYLNQEDYTNLMNTIMKKEYDTRGNKELLSIIEG